MNAPSGTYQGFGKNPRAVETVNRSLREVEPGVYATRARAPVAGIYDVAFFLDSPRMVHCFATEVGANPALKSASARYALEYLTREVTAAAGDNVAVRFRLMETVTGLGKEGLKDVTVLSFRAPGRDRKQTLAGEVGDGVYEVTLELPAPGAYYVYVTVPSLKIGWQDFVHLSLTVRNREGGAAGPGKKEGKEPK
jgi:hypothetical protein